ncbi:MAG: hypothetical protein HQ472_08415 [Ignavibacteria bacterium]|nr:hypothetical protein [Ignavibacteria bacterium]
MIYAAHEGAATGAQNMARDIELADSVRQGAFQLAFRTYTWNPWTLSLGMHQKEDAYNLEALKNAGYDIVRRPTGGRAVFHADELTYCIAAPLTETNTARSVYQSIHDFLHRAIVGMYPQLGIDMAGTSDDFRGFVTSASPAGKLCFATHARSELMIGNRKIVGSAQRVVDGVILQHGSILCGNGYNQLPNFLNADEKEKHTARQLVGSTSIGLEEALAGSIDIDFLGAELAKLAVQSMQITQLVSA